MPPSKLSRTCEVPPVQPSRYATRARRFPPLRARTCTRRGGTDLSPRYAACRWRALLNSPAGLLVTGLPGCHWRDLANYHARVGPPCRAVRTFTIWHYATASWRDFSHTFYRRLQAGIFRAKRTQPRHSDQCLFRFVPDPSTCRIAEPALTRRKIAGRTGGRVRYGRQAPPRAVLV